MKKPDLILTLSLTIIVFTLVTKWWMVIPVDGRETSMLGFPLPYAADAWHTSMAQQYFAVEFLVDLLLYFLISWSLISTFNRRTLGRRWLNRLKWPLVFLSLLFLTWNTIWILQPNNLFYWSRPFDYEFVDSGVQWWWGDRK